MRTHGKKNTKVIESKVYNWNTLLELGYSVEIKLSPPAILKGDYACIKPSKIYHRSQS